MEQSNILLVDMGNTAIKYVLLSERHIETSIQVKPIDYLCEKVGAWGITHAYFANVGAELNTTKFKQACELAQISPTEIKTEKEAFGITNCYADESMLGVDRWLAMIAGAQLTTKPFAIIDAGTAITCDFVAEGQHLGGWIAPGYQAMKSALLQKTTRVTANQLKPTSLTVGKKTEDCVSMGCLAALSGVTLSAYRFLSERFDDFCIIQCGGDKKMLASLLEGDNLCAANGVLLGLARYAERDLFGV